jgi:hypothetical protein
MRRNIVSRIVVLLSLAAALLLAVQGSRAAEHPAASAWSGRQVRSAAVASPGSGAAAHACQKGVAGDPYCSHSCCSPSIALGAGGATTGIVERDTAGPNLADRSLRSAVLGRDPPVPRPPV